MEHVGWWNFLYLFVMVGIIVTVTAIGANALLLKRCAACGARNLIDASCCRKCGARLNEDAASKQPPRQQ